MVMKKSSSSDRELLKRFENGDDVLKDERSRVEELASIGLVKLGLSLEKKALTAKTTSLGKKFLSP